MSGQEDSGIECKDEGARATVVAEFAEVDALPCSEIQPSVGYGYG